MTEFPMPFSAVLRPRGDTRLEIVEQHRNRTAPHPDIYLGVPAGVSTVRLTWDGAEQVTVNSASGGAPQRQGVGVVPAATGGGALNAVRSGLSHIGRVPGVQSGAHCGSRFSISRPRGCHNDPTSRDLAAGAVV